MPLRDRKYKNDQTLLKIFGYGDNKKIKVVHMNILRTSGIECEDDFKTERCCANDEKLSANISRAKSVIFELAYCNPWDWFFTATLDKQKYDRQDLEKFHRDITQWIRNYNRLHNTAIKFLLVPELHADGKSWHMHGLLYGLPSEHLTQFKVGDKMGKAIADKVKNGDIVYDWKAYSKKFGFCDLEPIKNSEAISKYITKYVCKDLESCVKELNAHLYYHSRGLEKAKVIKKGTMLADIVPDYENDYCSVSWIDYSESTLKELLSTFI